MYNTSGKMGRSSDLNDRVWQLQKVHVEMLGSGHYSSQCKAREHHKNIQDL